MNVAEWIIVAILSITLFVFLIVGIILITRLIGLSNELKKIAIESQDIARNANGIVTNVKGMTSIGGAVEAFVDKYVMPRVNNKTKSAKQTKEAKESKKKERSKDGEEE